jgi:DNA mismatch repair protein MutS2
VNAQTFRTLEFDAIRSALVSLAGSVGGRERLAALEPQVSPDAVREALATTSEGVGLLTTAGRQPYHDLPDVTDLLAAAQVAGLHLEPPALVDVASFIDGASGIARAVSRAEGSPRLARLAGGIRDASDVAHAIRRAILPTGEVADDASPRLADLRRRLARQKLQLQSVMESFLRGKDAERLLQDKIVTTRNDRYVLIVKADHRGQLPGVVHGASGSGASLFVEPLPAVELNNDIVALAEEERAEVVRILTALTERVGARAADLGQALDVLGRLDAVQAMALLAGEMRAVEPRVWEPGQRDLPAEISLDLIRARHPLLMPRLCERLGQERPGAREPVPVSLRVGFGSPVLVISGPNTGGKTVALKTVGLLALMAQAGLHIPAEEGSLLPVFRRVFADIGDDQSIAGNLSTFSAHLANLVGMTRDLSLPALVLLDEVGGGTDPTEGGALGVAVIEHFRAAGAMAVATTHHGLMKAYAQSTPGVACASFGYDPDTYEPTYSLSLGTAGRSLALEMAERLGLPASIVRDARARRDAKEAQAEALLQCLEDEQQRLSLERQQFERERAELTLALERQRGLERELEARKRGEVERFRRDLTRRGEEATRKAKDAVHQAVRKLESERRALTNAAGAARLAVQRAIREAHEDALQAPEVAPYVAPEPELPTEVLTVGCRVRVRTLGLIGQVLALDPHGEAELAISGKRLRVPQSDLAVLATPAVLAASRARNAPRPGSGVGTATATLDGGSSEVHVVGLRVDEALPKVDKALDDAALSDRRSVRVVHGFGQGKLRQAVAELLQGHPHVAAFRPADPKEGGAGVTVVDLKE